MSGFLYGCLLQCKVKLLYYVAPLIFFLFMGGIFTSIISDVNETLIQYLTVFGTSLGAILGSPLPLCELYGSDIKKAYNVGGILIWTVAVSNFISAFIHLSIVSFIIFCIAPIVFDAVIPSNLLNYFISLDIMLVASISVGTLL